AAGWVVGGVLRRGGRGRAPPPTPMPPVITPLPTKTTSVLEQATAQPASLEMYHAQALPLLLVRPAGWQVLEGEGRVALGQSEAALAGGEIEAPGLVLSRIASTSNSEAALQQTLPSDALVLRREETTLGGEPASLVEASVVSPSSGRAYGVLAIARVRGAQVYLALASAPLEQWQQARPVLENLISSIQFTD
ncbi:MAG: hypothetical protein ACUVX9_14625, partial [Anaerolineae bacterium]